MVCVLLNLPSPPPKKKTGLTVDRTIRGVVADTG